MFRPLFVYRFYCTALIFITENLILLPELSSTRKNLLHQNRDLPVPGQTYSQPAARHERSVGHIGSWRKREGPVWSSEGRSEWREAGVEPWGGGRSEGPIVAAGACGAARAATSPARFHVETAGDSSDVRLHFACYGTHKGGPLTFNVLCPAVVYLWAHSIGSGSIVGASAKEGYVITLRFHYMTPLYDYTFKPCRVFLSDIDPRKHPRKFAPQIIEYYWLP